MIYFVSFFSLFSMMLNFYVVRKSGKKCIWIFFFRYIEFVYFLIIFYFGLDFLLVFVCVCAEVYIEC